MKPAWKQFTNPAVRALAWALNSPALVRGFDGSLPSSSKEDLAFLAAVDAKPKALIEHLANCNSHRLGYYFESLWQFYFLHHPDYELVAHNLQVMDSNKRTLGAFDFIYQYLPSGDTHHLEVAVKFYLFVGDDTETQQQALWPGPNPKDNLASKIQRFVSHQLPLSSSPEGSRAIANSCAPAVSAKAALKGYLFLPWQGALAMPDWAPPQVCHGHWLPLSSLPQLLTEKSESKWTLLEKRRWLGEQMTVPVAACHSGSELIELLKASLSHYPVMIARLEESVEGYNEVERFFVVPDGWPAHSD